MKVDIALILLSVTPSALSQDLSNSPVYNELNEVKHLTTQRQNQPQIKQSGQQIRPESLKQVQPKNKKSDKQDRSERIELEESNSVKPNKNQAEKLSRQSNTKMSQKGNVDAPSAEDEDLDSNSTLRSSNKDEAPELDSVVKSSSEDEDPKLNSILKSSSENGSKINFKGNDDKDPGPKDGREAMEDFLISLMTNGLTTADGEKQIDEIVHAGDPKSIFEPLHVSMLDALVNTFYVTNVAKSSIESIKKLTEDQFIWKFFSQNKTSPKK